MSDIKALIERADEWLRKFNDEGVAHNMAYEAHELIPLFRTALQSQLWQDINSAPKDGTKIDVWRDGKRYCDVFWSFFKNAATGEALLDPVWDGWVQEGTTGMSYTPNYINYGYDKNCKRLEPTHWKPLPEAPNE